METPHYLSRGIQERILWALLLTIPLFDGSSQVWAQTSATPTRFKEAHSIDDLSVEDRNWIESRVRELIAKLADDRYSVRQYAASELQKIGVVAFEQLRKAQFDPDPQIASSASYLFQSIRQEWTWDSDPIEVRELLSHYGTKSPADRESLIDRLAKLKNDASVAALSRLCRYETTEYLSRRAALLLLSADVPSNQEDRLNQARLLKQVLGMSERQGSVWLKRYAETLETDSFDVPFWMEAARAEHRDATGPNAFNGTKNAIALYRWICQEFIRRDQDENALELAISMEDLIPPKAFDLTEACHWALSHQLGSWVIHLQSRYPDKFQSYGKLGYAYAESLVQSQEPIQAEKAADRAFHRGDPANPLPVIHLDERVSVADSLVERGLYSWAEREYGEAIKSADPLTRRHAIVFERYSKLLADGEKYSEAAQVWEPIATRIVEEPLFRAQIKQTYPDSYDGRADDGFRSRYLFYDAKRAILAKDFARASEQLALVNEILPSDSDAWIERYRIATDDDTRKEIQEGTANLLLKLRERIELAEGQLLEGSIETFALTRHDKAVALNELAWLESNLGGNLDEALKSAKMACELYPNESAYVDTLARVYFAKEEFSKAVALQTRAISLEPNDRQMQRVLQEYEKALAESGSTP